MEGYAGGAKNAELIIKAYFQALEKEDFIGAEEFLSNTLKASDSEPDTSSKPFVSIKLVSLKQANDRTHCPSDACFVVTFDVVSPSNPTLESGLNYSFVDVIKESDGKLRINGFNSGP